MREIEVKARLKDKAGFLKRAEQLGITFGPVISQTDTIFLGEHSEHDPEWNIFRLRKEKDKALLTMKYKASSRAYDRHERELEVSDEKSMTDILARVGYIEDISYTKHRQVAKYNTVELCLDEVEDLGWFVEAEILTDDTADADAVQAELWELLQQLGIKPADRLDKTYNELMREKLGKGPIK